MIYGLYLSAQGAETQALRQAVLANNMANVGTTAFKSDVPLFRAHLPFDLANSNPATIPDTHDQQTGGVELLATATNHAQGPLTPTHAPLDVAIVGPGYLQVTDGDAEFLTRNGRMALDPTGRIVTADEGHAVLSVDGEPIIVPPEASEVSIADDGTVSAVVGGAALPIGQLALVEPDSPIALEKLGNSLYLHPGGTVPAVAARIRQGMIEGSNTDSMTGMVDLIQTGRAFEMNMNLLRSQDEMLGQLIQSVPRR